MSMNNKDLVIFKQPKIKDTWVDFYRVGSTGWGIRIDQLDDVQSIKQ